LLVLTEPIRRERLYDQITRTIALRILHGDPEAQFLTSEVHLCRQLDVSRTVLREAVKVLAAKGLLEVRPKTGIRVRPRKDWNLLDPDLLRWQCEAGVEEGFVRNLCQVRFILEPATAELAANHATAEEVSLIQHWYQEMEGNLENFEKFVCADVEFHQAISSATHNDLLIRVNNTVLQALRATQDLFRNFHGGARRAALPLHKQVAEAVSKHDAAAARSAMCLVVRQAEQDIYLAVRSGDATTDVAHLRRTAKINQKAPRARA
jgi:DNA-binding FadR family transcriptional regulator